MSDHENWNNSQPDAFGSGTRSSQETLCNADNLGCDGNSQLKGADGLSLQVQESIVSTLSVSDAEGGMPEGLMSENLVLQGLTTAGRLGALGDLGLETPIEIDEETKMCYNGFTSMQSMQGHGDVSSSYEAMESDDTGMESESMPIGGKGRRLPYNWAQVQSTTTPGASSDDDPYSPASSRKKRRKTKRYQDYSKHGYNFTSPLSSQIPSPSPSGETGANETEDSNAPFSVTHRRSINSLQYSTNFNNSDSNLHSAMNNSLRRLSNASESSQNTSLNRDAATGADNLPLPGQEHSRSAQSRRHHHHHRASANNSAMVLNIQHPSSAHNCSLSILVQPEQQHRARYLTEGSRGPVKDHTQQAYPKIELKGYTGKTSLHVYVGSESDDKIRPHGFYQACKVTGRNTTPCEEVNIDGTKVIKIPFDASEPISVDCVGILKLRNADVEARIGVRQAKKRSQTVKLVFRVVLEDVPNAASPVILQVASNRINCTQPPGQPEITKKSLDRCAAKGDVEMFIIGRNFHKGTTVIFQDPEEADGSHWHTVGTLDKDNFHQTHLVVRVPPYHDQNIVKPVNVQVMVEHNGRKCDPHSFTYDPNPKPIKPNNEATNSQNEEAAAAKKDTENPVQALLNANIDRNVLEALMKLLKPEVDANDIKAPTQVAQPAVVNQAAMKVDNTNQPMAFPPQQPTQPIQFVSKQLPVSSAVERPIPSHTPASAQFIFKPTIGGSQMTLKQTGPFSSITSVNSQHATNANAQVAQNMPAASSFAFGATSSSPSVIVKTEAQPWGQEQPAGFPNSVPGQSHNMVPVEKAGTILVRVTGQNPQVAVGTTQLCMSQASQGNVVPQGGNVLTQAPSQFSTPVHESALFSTLSTNMLHTEILTAGPNFGYSNEMVSPDGNSQGIPSQVTAPISGTPGIAASIALPTNMGGIADNTSTAVSWGQAQSTHRNSIGNSPPEQPQQQSTPSPQVVSSPHSLISPEANASSGPPANFVWPTSQHLQSSPNFAAPQNTNNMQQVQASQALWTKPEQGNSGEVLFTHGTVNQKPNELAISSDQQLFTISESMQILEQNKPVTTDMSLMSSSTPMQQHQRTSSLVQMVSPSGVVQNSPGMEPGSLVQSPLTETGLSIGFDNNFSLNDSPQKSLESSMINDGILQDIISECSNQQAPPANLYSNSASPALDNNTASPIAFQNAVPQAMSANAMPQTSLFNTTEQSNANPQFVSTFSASQDLSLGHNLSVNQNQGQMNMQHQQQQQQQHLPKQEDLFADDITSLLTEENLMETSMYLVDPNVVQRQDTNSNNAFQHGMSQQQVQQQPPQQQQQQQQPQVQAHAPELKNFKTIDSAVLGLPTENSTNFVQPGQQVFENFSSGSNPPVNLEEQNLK